jgi:hypothetical protein
MVEADFGRTEAGRSRFATDLIWLALHSATRREIGQALTFCIEKQVDGMEDSFLFWVGQACSSVLLRRRRVSGLGSRMITLAATILPASSRLRYEEEFESELAEIATRCGRIQQICYGIRVLLHVIVLRWELRKPAQERAR